VVSYCCSRLITCVCLCAVWDVAVKEDDPSSWNNGWLTPLFPHTGRAGDVVVAGKISFMRQHLLVFVGNQVKRPIAQVGIVDCRPHGCSTSAIRKSKVGVVLMPRCAEALQSGLPKSLAKIAGDILLLILLQECCHRIMYLSNPRETGKELVLWYQWTKLEVGGRLCWGHPVTLCSHIVQFTLLLKILQGTSDCR